VKIIGRVEGRCGTRTLILRCDPAQLPRLYADIIDRKMRPVGRVVDIFGNIRAPYAAIFCRNSCDIPAGEKLFAK
jgi:RNA-binding protein